VVERVAFAEIFDGDHGVRHKISYDIGKGLLRLAEVPNAETEEEGDNDRGRVRRSKIEVNNGSKCQCPDEIKER
jgi:hypothetical protein